MENKVRPIPTFEAYRGRLRKLKGYNQVDIPLWDEFDKKAREMYIAKYGSIDAMKVAEEKKAGNIITENEVGVWQNREEAEKALKIYTDYQTGKNITEPSDLDLLKTLVGVIIKKNRVMADPKSYVKDLTELTNVEILLKTKLGLLGEQSSDGVAERIKSLMRKAAVWRAKNRVSYTIRCGECGKENLLRIRTAEYEAFKHPFYHDRVLCNPHLWMMYKEGKITKLDIAKVLFADKAKENTFYVDWLERKIYNLQDNNAGKTDNPTGT